MNKTFLKRSLASATGAVLALGQVAATLGTANAAVNVTVDKEWVTTVPVVAANLPSPDSLPASAGFSDWNDRVDTWMLFIEEEEQTTTIAKDNFVGMVRNTLAGKFAFLDDATMDAIVDALHDAEVTTSYDGTVHAVLVLDNVGPVLAQRGISAAAAGSQLTGDIDWSGIQISGAIDVTLTFDFEAKKVKTELAFIDENGKSYNLDSTSDEVYDYSDAKYQEIRDYVAGIYEEQVNAALEENASEVTAANGETYQFESATAGSIVFTDANGNTYTLTQTEDGAFVLSDASGKSVELDIKSEEVQDQYDQAVTTADAWEQYLDRADNAYARAIEVVKKANAAVQDVTYSGTDFEEAYAAFRAYAIDKATVAAGDVVNKYEQKVLNAVNKLPETLKDLINYEGYGISYSTIAEYFESFPGVDWQLTSADIADMVDSAYDVTININGYSFDTTFSFGDSQTEELIDAYAEQYADYFAEKNEQVVDVISHKVATIVRDDAANTIYFDIERIIDEVVTEEIVTTTTTTETTIESSTETTPESTETTPVTTETTPASTETTPASTETTPASTETTPATTETTPVTSTETSETTTETSGTTTETTPAVVFDFEMDEIEDSIGYYWVEEDEPFTCFQNFKASLTVNGDDGSQTKLDADSAWFAPNVACAADFGATEYTKEQVKLLVTEEGAEKINALIAEAGLDETVAAGDVAASYDITLVVRGKSDMLDTVIDADDAVCALRFYVRNIVLEYSYTDAAVVETVRRGAAVDYAGAFYALDVDADGFLKADDSVLILRYYVRTKVMEMDADFDEMIAKGPATHNAGQHINPFEGVIGMETGWENN